MIPFGIFIAKKKIEKITVKEITNRAGYNRGTFYEYFTDVYDVLDVIANSLIPSLHELPVSTPTGTIGMPIDVFFNIWEQNAMLQIMFVSRPSVSQNDLACKENNESRLCYREVSKVFTKIAYIEEGLKISRKTAAKYLSNLETEGFLVSEKIGRERIYLNKSLFEIVKNSEKHSSRTDKRINVYGKNISTYGTKGLWVFTDEY